MKRESLEKGTFPLDESKAADEELFALKKESLEKGTFPLSKLKVADESFLL